MAKTKNQAARQAAARSQSTAVGSDRKAKIEAAQKANKQGVSKVVIATVLAVLLVVGVVAFVAVRATQEKNTITASGTAVPKGAAAMGKVWYSPENTPTSASVPTVWVVEDFRCPVCKGFEDAFGATIKDAAKSGKIKLGYWLKTVIDGNLGSDNSQVAGSNMLCAADAGKGKAYHDWLYANQPAEGTLFTKAQFTDAAKAAGLSGSELDTWQKCADAGKYMNYVASTEKASFDLGVKGTPALYINGTPVEWSTFITADKQPDTAALLKALESGTVPSDKVAAKLPKLPLSS